MSLGITWIGDNGKDYFHTLIFPIFCRFFCGYYTLPCLFHIFIWYRLVLIDLLKWCFTRYYVRSGHDFKWPFFVAAHHVDFKGINHPAW